MAQGISPDNPVIRLLNRLGDIMLLSILTVVFCIPIITIGASITSASYCVHKAISGEDGYIFKRFLHAFKTNFKQSTIAYLIMLVIGVLFAFDTMFWVRMWTSQGAEYAKALIVISSILDFIYALILVYIFPLIGNYDNTLKGHFKNAFLIAINKLPVTLLLIVIYAVVGYFLWDNVPLILIFIIIGTGLLEYGLAFIYRMVFKSIMKQAKKAQKEIEEENKVSDEDDVETDENDGSEVDENDDSEADDKEPVNSAENDINPVNKANGEVKSDKDEKGDNSNGEEKQSDNRKEDSKQEDSSEKGSCDEGNSEENCSEEGCNEESCNEEGVANKSCTVEQKAEKNSDKGPDKEKAKETSKANEGVQKSQKKTSGKKNKKVSGNKPSQSSNKNNKAQGKKSISEIVNSVTPADDDN